jgi:hypothetical protein
MGPLRGLHREGPNPHPELLVEVIKVTASGHGPWAAPEHLDLAEPRKGPLPSRGVRTRPWSGANGTEGALPDEFRVPAPPSASAKVGFLDLKVVKQLLLSHPRPTPIRGVESVTGVNTPDLLPHRPPPEARGGVWGQWELLKGWLWVLSVS